MIMESREHNQSQIRGPWRASSQERERRTNEKEETARRVSFQDEIGANDDPNMRVFHMTVYYSEAAIDGALKTYPETKVAAIVSPVLANRSNFVNCIRQKLTAIGLNPHARLSLTPIPRVPAHRDYSIAQWLGKYPGAAMVVSPEDKQDTLYRQLANLKGQAEPENPPDPIYDPIPSPSAVEVVEPMEGSSGGNWTSLTLGSSSSLPTGTVSGQEGIRQEAGQSSPTKKSGGAPVGSTLNRVHHTGNTGSADGSLATPISPATPSSGASSPGSITTHRVMETSRLQLRLLEEKFVDATSQLMRLEYENASKDMTIELLEKKVQEFNHRLDEVDEALSFTRSESYAAQVREVYRRMFLECVRKRVRAKVKAQFKCPPNPMDFLLVSYDRVLEACQNMDDLEMQVGLSLADLKLTMEHASAPRPVVHSNEHVHIGVYAEMAHSQGPPHQPGYRNLFFFLYNQEPQTVLDNLINSWT